MGEGRQVMSKWLLEWLPKTSPHCLGCLELQHVAVKLPQKCGSAADDIHGGSR